MSSHTYFLEQRSWEREAERLRALERWCDPYTTEVLARTGVGPGWRCLEVGAGAGSIARWLAAAVGDEGHVLAVDLETDLLEDAKTANLEVRRLDVLAEPLPVASFDLVHAREVLGHPPDPDVALDRMIDALRPGGWLVVGAADFACCELGRWPTHPPEAAPAVTAVIVAGLDLIKTPGYDDRLGRSLVDRLHAHRLSEIGGEIRAPLADRDGCREWMALTVERTAQQLLASGRVDERELRGFRAVLDPPEGSIAGPLYAYGWGRKPSSPAII